MKISKTKKTFGLFVVMAAMLALPTIASAQENRSAHGGLFGTSSSAETASNEQGLLSGANASGIHSNQTKDESPIGSGIAILLLAGAGYAAFKKKED